MADQDTTTRSEAVIYPSVRFADADAGIEWLESVLGFEPREIVRDESGTVVHGELAFGGSLLMVGSAGAGREPFRSLPAGRSLTYIAVADPDGLHARAVGAGAEVAMPPTDTDYGSRDFTLRDPEGNLWSFGTYRPEAG